MPAEEGGYPVKNWEHPELWETMLPHDGVPRLALRRQSAEVNFAPATLVHDLTLTEGGLWNRLEDAELDSYVDLLRRLAGTRGVVRCLEVPGADVNRVARLVDKNTQFPEIVSRVERDAKLDKVATEQVCADFAGSDFWLQGVAHSSRQDEYKAIQSFVSRCFDIDKIPVVRLLDVSRGVASHYLLGIAAKLLKLADEKDLPVKLRLVDSLGLFHEHPAAAPPRGLPWLLNALTQDVRYPGEWLIVEPANDGGRAAAVAQACWFHGAAAVGATLGGRGPRAGLAALETTLMDLVALRADAPRINLGLLRELEDLVTSSGAVDKLPANQPLLGSAAFQPRQPECADVDTLANACDPGLVWGIRPGRTLGAHSTRSDVVEWLRDQLGRGVILSPEHPGVVKMSEWVVASGRPSLGDKELLRQARRYLPGFFVMEGRS